MAKEIKFEVGERYKNPTGGDKVLEINGNS